jgi:sulfoxide reductase catalytic subunit YedY
MKKIASSEITPETIYLSRRRFLKGALFSATAAALAACVPAIQTQNGQTSPTPSGGALTDERGNPANSYDNITLL